MGENGKKLPFLNTVMTKLQNFSVVVGEKRNHYITFHKQRINQKKKDKLHQHSADQQHRGRLLTGSQSLDLDDLHVGFDVRSSLL